MPDISGDYFHTCRFLQLKPYDKREGQHLKALKWEAEAEDNDPQERAQYIKQIIGEVGLFSIVGVRLLCAWCTKLDQCCVLTESVVISESTPLGMILFNNDRLQECSEGEKDEPEQLQLKDWVFRYLLLE